MDATPTALDRLGWAMRAPIDDPTIWRTLVTLANHADETGLAYPRVTNLAEEVRRGDRCVGRALDWLDDHGYIARVRLRRNGQLRGYLYRVLAPGSPGMSLDLLPAFAAGVDLPAAWTRAVPVDAHVPLEPTPSVPTRTVSQCTPTYTQEPPTGEPPTRSKACPTSADADAAAEDPAAEFDATTVDLTRHLGVKVRGNGHKIPKPGSKAARRWYADVDKMLRLDGHDPGEVRRVIDWSTDHEFWRANIQSAGKLREKYSTLRLQMNRNGHADRRPRNTIVSDFSQYGAGGLVRNP